MDRARETVPVSVIYKVRTQVFFSCYQQCTSIFNLLITSYFSSFMQDEAPDLVNPLVESFVTRHN